MWQLLSLSVGVLAVFHAHAAGAGWKLNSPRPQTAAQGSIDTQLQFEGQPTLRLQGNGKAYVDGRWERITAVTAGEHYRFSGHFKTQHVENVDRHVLARVYWLDATGSTIGFAEYPTTLPLPDEDGWRVLQGAYQAPPLAATARLELHYRWDADGVVNFSAAVLEPVAPPAARSVRLATVFHRPRNSASLDDNLAQWGALVAQAASQKADLVTLPEGITLIGRGQENFQSVAEPIPGKTTAYLGQLAQAHKLYIVAALEEKEGDAIYNTAVLIDRAGQVAGKYRKVSLPDGEIDGGIAPGSSFPVFKTDFGTVGMMICWDVMFPEAARALAKGGAEIILLPIWGGNLTLARARAIENHVFLVSSTYDMISAVFDEAGEVLQQATDQAPVVTVEVALGRTRHYEWVGDFKSRIPREMPR